MRCAVIRLPDGQGAIVCGRGPMRRARCHVCGSPAAFQCDASAPTKRSGTCDRYVCERHRTRVLPGIDHCPQHAAQPRLPGL